MKIKPSQGVFLGWKAWKCVKAADEWSTYVAPTMLLEKI